MDGYIEQELFYVATPRSDGEPPALSMAICGRFFADAKDAQQLADFFSYPTAVYRVVARIPAKPETGER